MQSISNALLISLLFSWKSINCQRILRSRRRDYTRYTSLLDRNPAFNITSIKMQQGGNHSRATYIVIKKNVIEAPN